MVATSNISSVCGKMKVSFYLYRGKLFEVWWRKTADDQWEFAYSPRKIMLPKEFIQPHEITEPCPLLNKMIEYNLYEEYAPA